MNEKVYGQVRAVLAALGGAAVAAGWFPESVAAQLVGALAVLITMAWSFFSKTTPPEPKPEPEPKPTEPVKPEPEPEPEPKPKPEPFIYGKKY